MKGCGDMNMEQVSVIIPVYNAEKFLRRCLDSLRNQTYRNIEVLMVDDGSTDRSLKICKGFAEKDGRFKVLQKQNGGASSARNLGLTNSGGGYVLFVDADDWLPLGAVETLWKKRQETDADYVGGNIMQIFPLRSAELHLFDEASFAKTDVRAFDKFFTSHFTAYAPWAHLYKNQIIQAAGLKFNTDIVFGEDALFNYQYLQHCSRIATTGEVVYYYNRVNSGSITKNYCPSKNKDTLFLLNERRKLYSGELTEAQSYKEDDQLLFAFTFICQDYIFFLPKDSAVEKLRETHLMYRPLLDGVGTYNGDIVQSQPIKSWLDYRRFLDESDYEGLYEYFRGQPNYRAFERRYPLARSILTRLRIFQLFQLRIGYR